LPDKNRPTTYAASHADDNDACNTRHTLWNSSIEIVVDKALFLCMLLSASLGSEVDSTIEVTARPVGPTRLWSLFSAAL
jgi:hypothetical protein